jgi:hypothetical protein
MCNGIIQLTQWTNTPHTERKSGSTTELLNLHQSNGGDYAGRLYGLLAGRRADTSLDQMTHCHYRDTETSLQSIYPMANIWIGRTLCREAPGVGEQDHHHRRRRDRGRRSCCGLPTRQAVQKLIPSRHSLTWASKTPSAANSDADFAPDTSDSLAPRSSTQEDGARQHCLQQSRKNASR